MGGGGASRSAGLVYLEILRLCFALVTQACPENGSRFLHHSHQRPTGHPLAFPELLRLFTLIPKELLTFPDLVLAMFFPLHLNFGIFFQEKK